MVELRIKEVSEKFSVEITTLEYYEQVGLFDDVKRVDGVRDYGDYDIERLGMILSLNKVGLSLETILNYIELTKNDDSKSKRVQLLKKERKRLLDDIHDQQKNLDSLDCMIYQLKRCCLKENEK